MQNQASAAHTWDEQCETSKKRDDRLIGRWKDGTDRPRQLWMAGADDQKRDRRIVDEAEIRSGLDKTQWVSGCKYSIHSVTCKEGYACGATTALAGLGPLPSRSVSFKLSTSPHSLYLSASRTRFMTTRTASSSIYGTTKVYCENATIIARLRCIIESIVDRGS